MTYFASIFVKLLRYAATAINHQMEFNINLTYPDLSHQEIQPNSHTAETHILTIRIIAAFNKCQKSKTQLIISPFPSLLQQLNSFCGIFVKLTFLARFNFYMVRVITIFYIHTRLIFDQLYQLISFMPSFIPKLNCHICQ